MWKYLNKIQNLYGNIYKSKVNIINHNTNCNVTSKEFFNKSIDNKDIYLILFHLHIQKENVKKVMEDINNKYLNILLKKNWIDSQQLVDLNFKNKCIIRTVSHAGFAWKDIINSNDKINKWLISMKTSSSSKIPIYKNEYTGNISYKSVLPVDNFFEKNKYQSFLSDQLYDLFLDSNQTLEKNNYFKKASNEEQSYYMYNDPVFENKHKEIVKAQYIGHINNYEESINLNKYLLPHIWKTVEYNYLNNEIIEDDFIKFKILYKEHEDYLNNVLSKIGIEL